jgi:hypothetical protein
LRLVWPESFVLEELVVAAAAADVDDRAPTVKTESSLFYPEMDSVFCKNVFAFTRKTI